MFIYLRLLEAIYSCRVAEVEDNDLRQLQRGEAWDHVSAHLTSIHGWFGDGGQQLKEIFLNQLNWVFMDICWSYMRLVTQSLQIRRAY